MSIENLILGIGFAVEHELTLREMQVLLPFLSKPYTTQGLADEIGANKISLHHIIQRLKLKKLIVLEDRDEKGTFLYKFNA